MSAELKEFLAGIRLEHLYDVFVSNGIDMDVVAELNAEDLIELNLNMGERKRFLKELRTQAAAPIDTSVNAGPERRQLTVMFVDLVGSTALSASHDVEDLRTVVGEYQSCCAAIIQKHGGTIAKYMGDGILAYFGYPSAAEHSAEHSARCGLELIKAVNRLTPLPDVKLSCRVAAATGMVIVGDLIGSGDSQERQVVGETPNLAGRLQSLAAPDQMIISDKTNQMLTGLFECQPLGKHRLKGFEEPLECFAVIGEHEVESRFRARREGRSLSPLQGRDTELAALLKNWENCHAGKLNSTLIVADAGIGKSRLIAELIEKISDDPHEVIELACHPQFVNSALKPLANFAERLFGWARGESPASQYSKLSDYLLSHDMKTEIEAFAATLGVPAEGLYQPPTESPQIQRSRMAKGFAKLLAARAQQTPLLILFEDLHWADATTLEVLPHLLEGLKQAPILFVASSRNTIDLGIARAPDTITMELAGIDAQAAIEMTLNLTGGKTLSKDLTDHILAQAEGNPLFLEELTKSLLESDAVKEEDGVIQVRHNIQSQIPSTLQDSLMARLDRVATAKELAQIGAVIGREFSLDLLSDVCGQSPEIVVAAVSILEHAEIVFPVDGRQENAWIFKHALIQEAAYDSLLRSRRKELHSLIARAYEKVRSEEIKNQPEILAHHLGNAGQYPQAIEYGLAAGLAALMRSENVDAVAHGKKSLEWSKQISNQEEQGRLELKIQAILTPALMQSQGYSAPDVEESANRALKLLKTHGDLPEAFPNLWGLKMYRHVRSERKQARDIAERFVALAERIGDGSQLVAGLPPLGQCSWIEGNLSEAEAELRRCIQLYDRTEHGMHGAMYGMDSRSYSEMTLAQVLWITGRCSEAVHTADAALSHAKELNHTNTIGIALLYQIMLKQQNGLKELVAADASQALEYCERMGVSTPTSYIAMISNWSRGDFVASQEIYEMHNMIGAQLGMTYYRSLGAENAIEAGEHAIAKEILEAALKQASETGEKYWLPQLLRLQSRIESTIDKKIELLNEARSVAQTSGAKMLEALAILDLLENAETSHRTMLSDRLNELINVDKVELAEIAMDRFKSLSEGVG